MPPVPLIRIVTVRLLAVDHVVANRIRPGGRIAVALGGAAVSVLKEIRKT